MMRALARTLLLAPLLGCDQWLSDLEPKPDTVTVKQVVDLRRVGDTLFTLNRADTAAMLVAHIASSATPPTVAFTTSAGSFVLTGSKEATVRAEADPSDPQQRYAARIEIRRDTSAYAIVSATVAGYRDTVRVKFR
jgi:hypothetical protein